MFKSRLQRMRRAFSPRSKRDNGKGKAKDTSLPPAPLYLSSSQDDYDYDYDDASYGAPRRPPAFQPVAMVESRFLSPVEEVAFNIPMNMLTEYMYCVEDVVVDLLARHPLVVCDFDLLCQFILTPFTAPQVALNATVTTEEGVQTKVKVDQVLMDQVFAGVMRVAPRLRTREADVSFQLFFRVQAAGEVS